MTYDNEGLSMTNYKIGIKLTQNPEKYKTLLSVLKSELISTDGIEFIHIPTDNELEQFIPDIDILTTYHMKKPSFACATDRLKWIGFSVAGLEKN